MGGSVELFPGFPLGVGDYRPLLDALGAIPPIRVAHSLGALDAFAHPSDRPLALLAPSSPGPRRGRALVRAALTVAARTPARTALATRLRTRTFARYDAAVPVGEPLPLAEAARRLRAESTVALPALGRVIVLCSRTDGRHPAQQELARRLGAPVHWIDGGHLFPITNPVGTAELILAELGG